MVSRSRAAFTLVELLVVVLIIAMLMGLLLPAVLNARNRARTTQCMNHQKQLAMAIIAYDVAKGHLPGYANNVGPAATPTRVSWAPVILPFMSRPDLWEGPSKMDGWRAGVRPGPLYPPMVRVNEFVCPNDASNPAPAAPALSYAVNLGEGQYQTVPQVFDPTLPATQLGVFRDLPLGATPITMSKIVSPSRRPLISDNPYMAIRDSGTHRWMVAGRQWTDLDAPGVMPPVNVTANRLGFVWPSVGLARDYGPVDFAAGESPLGTSDALTNHSGATIVTFCDGHTESLNDEAQCGEFDYLPIQ